MLQTTTIDKIEFPIDLWGCNNDDRRQYFIDAGLTSITENERSLG